MQTSAGQGMGLIHTGPPVASIAPGIEQVLTGRK